MITMNKTTYRNPVIVWHNELVPEAQAHAEPPPAPFTVTRSEVIVQTEKVTVHIWFALTPAMPPQWLCPRKISPIRTSSSRMRPGKPTRRSAGRWPGFVITTE